MTYVIGEPCLPGRAEPLGSLGGGAKVGRTGADTPLVAALPPRAEAEA